MRICTAIGILPSSLGPINDNSLGNKEGSMANSNHNGNKYRDATIAISLIQRIKVPTAGDCRYSSACSRQSKNVVGKITTLGDVSTITMTCPSRICCEATSGLSV